MSDTPTHYPVVRDGVTYEYVCDGNQSEMRGLDENGSYSAWDLGHYRKVMEAREKLNLNKVVRRNVAHPLVGKELVNAQSGKRYIVESVKKNWYFGSFFAALLRNGNSHVEALVENINCVNPTIRKLIHEFGDTYQVVN